MNKNFITLILFTTFSVVFANHATFVPKRCTFSLSVRSVSNDIKAKRFIAVMSEKTRSWQSRGYKDFYNNIVTFLNEVQAAVASGVNLILTPKIETVEVTDIVIESEPYVGGNFNWDAASSLHPELPYDAEARDWEYNTQTGLWQKIPPTTNENGEVEHISFSFNIFADNEQGLSVYNQAVEKLTSIVQSLPSLSDVASMLGSIFSTASQQLSVAYDQAAQVADELADQASQIAAEVSESASQIAGELVEQTSQIATSAYDQASDIAAEISEHASVAADYVSEQATIAIAYAKEELAQQGESDSNDEAIEKTN